MDTNDLVASCRRISQEIGRALAEQSDWGESGLRAGQYQCDIVADRIGVDGLLADGFGVLSEESGLHEPDRQLIAVIDPVDGSTNASMRLPWYATSICVLDNAGPLVATVVNQSTGTFYEAVRGKGARRDGVTITASGTQTLDAAIVGLSGYPARHFGWRQYRALGAAALDLCAVAEGSLDGYIDCDGAHGPWDYLGGMLICLEAGACVGEIDGRELSVVDHKARRGPVAAGTPALLEELLAAQHLNKDH